MVSACVLISTSTGTMATNSKEKVHVCVVCLHVCVFVCLSFYRPHSLVLRAYVCYTYAYIYVCRCVCACVYVCICACVVCVHVCVCTHTCMCEYSILYSGKLSREKTFMNFEVCSYSRKFSLQKWGAWYRLAATPASNVRNVSPQKSSFHQIAKVLSLESFPLYGI